MSYQSYLLQRLLFMIGTLFILSFMIFYVIQLAPGDAVDREVSRLRSQGNVVSEEMEQQLRAQFGLDRPLHLQYSEWIFNFVRGDFDRIRSNVVGQTASELIAERLGPTLFISLLAVVLTYSVAIPIGIYTAANQYSLADYFWTFIGFIGLAIPNFILALILLYFSNRFFGLSVGGLISPDMRDAPWNLAKIIDFINHLWVPIIVIVSASTAGLIRTMRATLLDELGKPYVVTARAKGVPPSKLLLKYPVRLALNPIINSIGYILPGLISGQTIVAIVLNLPTLGPLLFNALIAEDLQLAATILMIQSILAVVGVGLADIALMLYDPRIRMERGNS